MSLPSDAETQLFQSFTLQFGRLVPPIRLTDTSYVLALRGIFAAVLFYLILPDFALRAKIWKNKSLYTLLPQANPADDYATA
jgi:hypothetical protein